VQASSSGNYIAEEAFKNSFVQQSPNNSNPMKTVLALQVPFSFIIFFY